MVTDYLRSRMPRKKIENTLRQKENLIPREEENISTEKESLQFLCQKIREARIANNLSLESVSGHLHIGVKILEAIEEGKPENGPTPVFFRGMVRTYSQFLELDKTEIIDKIDNLLKAQDPVEEIKIDILKPILETKDSHPIRNAFTILVILLGGYLFYSFYIVQEPIFLASDNITQTAPEVVEVETKIDPEQTITPTIQELVVVPESSPEIQEESIEVPPTDENQTEKVESIQPEVVVIPVEPLTLEVEASEGTWVSISVDGKETEEFRIEADEIQQWEATDSYLLTLGNTQVVRVLLNGREIETNRTHQLLIDWIVDSSLLP